MTPRWPSLLAGFLLALLLGYGLLLARTTSLQAEAAAGYLGAKIPGVSKPDGTPYRRYELIDAALQEFITAHKAPDKQ